MRLFRRKNPAARRFNELQGMFPEANEATVAVEFLAEIINNLPVSAQTKKDLPLLFQYAAIKEEKGETLIPR